MATETQNASKYTPAQEAIIRAAADDNGGVLNLEIAKALADREDMRDPDGKTERSYRSIVAKINRMGLPYERKVPMTKDGKPISKKADIVKAIAEAASLRNSLLEGLENAPKKALEALRDAFVTKAA